MNNVLSSYILSSAFMVIIMSILVVRSFSAISYGKSRARTQLLIGMTVLYIIADCVFIVCHLSENLSVSTWKIVSFAFYLVYTLLPFIWHVFVRNFVGSTMGWLFRKLELLPILILLFMVAVTPFTGALYYFNAEGMYTRGFLYNFYSYLNYFYYAETILDLIIIQVNRKTEVERYALHTMLISLIVLIGAVINNTIIPVGTIFPFMPYCSIVVTIMAFYFIATKDTDLFRQQQQEIVNVSLQKAQEASRAKTDFLSRMSHDIRTPMNAIINLTELARHESDQSLVREYLDKIAISSDFLLGLINDILDVSRIESGKLTLHKEPLTRQEFLASIETVIIPLMAERSINFHNELNPGEYIILVDKVRFNQIFFNLLSNAVKFTPDGGDIWLKVTNLETADNKLKIRISVRDNGIGMSEEFQKHMFEPFEQESSKLSDGTKGTGLGLSIVKNLVEAMNGTISVRSKLGEGTEFVIIFEADIVRQNEISSSDSLDSSDSQASSSLLKGLRILLAEDNEINTYVVKIILEKVGCVITTVENGQIAVDTFAASRPYSFDAILMDVRMPVMDGLKATKAIRALNRPDAVSVPIIAMTADAFDDERSRTLESGMNYHMSKPIDAQQLYKVLQTFCTKCLDGV